MRALPLLLALPATAAAVHGAAAGPPQRRVALPVPDYVCSWEREPADWLLDHQEPDGSWDADDFGRHDWDGAPDAARGGPDDDLAVTAWVALAWLGDGTSPRLREGLGRALDWLADQVDPPAEVGAPAAAPSPRARALGTLALCEALHLDVVGGREGERAALRPRIERALAQLARRADPAGGWTADGRPGSPIDARASAWSMLALLRAGWIGLASEPELLQRAAARLARETDDARGAFGPSGDPTGTGWAIVARLAAGHRPDEHPELRCGTRLLVDGLEARVEVERPDPECWLAIGLAAYALGGREWDDWSRAFKDSGLLRLRGVGSDRPMPCDPERCPEGSVAATAEWILGMELYFRYIRVLWI